MFLTTKKPKEVEQKFDPNLAEQIHVMPPRYVAESKKIPLKQILLIIAIFVGLAGIGVGGVIFINNFFNTEADIPAASTASNFSPSVPAAETPPANIAVNLPPSSPALQPTAPAEISPEPVPTTGAEDDDQDGLTLNEERLYLSNSLSADTDGDGYLDGAEVKNGFDPHLAAQTLEKSGLALTYQNSTQSYSVSYPKDWYVNTLSVGGAEIVFDSKLGEFIKIFTKANPNHEPLLSWIALNDLLVNAGELIAVQANSLPGYKTPDGLKFFLAKPDLSSVYIIGYESAGVSAVSFKTTLELMVNSFKLADQ